MPPHLIKFDTLVFIFKSKIVVFIFFWVFSQGNPTMFFSISKSYGDPSHRLVVFSLPSNKNFWY